MSESRENNRPVSLLVCGINHHNASLQEREQLQLNRHELVKALKWFVSMEGVTEVAMLSTCNRFEIYFCMIGQKRAFEVVRRFYRKVKKIDIRPHEHLFFSRHGSSVVRHLCRVAAGMDSLVIGETQIIGQVREAYSLACSLKTPGKILHKAFHAAFRAGKAVRTETPIGQGQRSVAGEAVALLKQKVSPEEAILIVGVNENTKLAAKCLVDAGYRNLTFANRTRYKAEKLAAQFDAPGMGLDTIQRQLNRSRVLISCTGAPGYLFSAEQVKEWRAHQEGMIYIVDMAVPRDVDIGNLTPGEVQVLDLQDLKNHLELAALERKAHFPRAEQVIEREVSQFQVWLETCEDPLLGDMAEKFELIRQRQLAAYRDRFDARGREQLEEFSRKLVRHLLSVPQKYLAQNSTREGKTQKKTVSKNLWQITPENEN